MNDHFGSSVSALEKIKISEIKRIWVNPIEIFIEFKEVTHIENKKLLQEYHTQADENRAVETAILIMHLADCASILLFWKWIQCVCSTREFSVGEYIKLKSFQKYLDFFFSAVHVGYTFKQLCFISEPIFTFCCQLLLLLSPRALLDSHLPPNLYFKAYISSAARHWFLTLSLQ